MHQRRYYHDKDSFQRLDAHRKNEICRSLANGCHRYFSTKIQKPLSEQIVTPYPPLSEPLKELPPVQYARPTSAQRETRITTLPNGLRVASESRFGQFCTIGVVIDSGPRYEVAFPSGVSHFLEKLAFHSTQEFSDKDKIIRAMEKHGGICDCQSSRDTVIYASSADRRGIETVTRVLAEAVLRPKLEENEIDFARQLVLFELETLNMRPEQEPISCIFTPISIAFPHKELRANFEFTLAEGL